MTRGEIWWVNLGEPFGSEPGFIRPVLIVQDNSYNESRLNTVIVVCLTTNLALADAPGNVFIKKSISNLPKDSVINVTQLASIDKKRFGEKVSKLDYDVMYEIGKSLKMVLCLN
jgi:mRNA interferase MazF